MGIWKNQVQMILFFTPFNNLNPEHVNQGAELAFLLYELSPILKENPNNASRPLLWNCWVGSNQQERHGFYSLWTFVRLPSIPPAP